MILIYYIKINTRTGISSNWITICGWRKIIRKIWKWHLGFIHAML